MFTVMNIKRKRNNSNILVTEDDHLGGIEVNEDAVFYLTLMKVMLWGVQFVEYDRLP